MTKAQWRGIGLLLIVMLAAVGVMTTSADDGRFCFGPGQVRAAVYANSDEGLDLYVINASDAGELIASFSGDDLAEIETDDNKPVLIYASSAAKNGVIDVAFYLLPSGEYQINVGPNHDKEVFACIFSRVPDFDARIDTFKI